MTDSEPNVICAKCGKGIHWLEVFPGRFCLDCHAKRVEGMPLERPDFVGALNIGKRRKVRGARVNRNV